MLTEYLFIDPTIGDSLKVYLLMVLSTMLFIIFVYRMNGIPPSHFDDQDAGLVIVLSVFFPFGLLVGFVGLMALIVDKVDLSIFTKEL